MEKKEKETENGEHYKLLRKTDEELEKGFKRVCIDCNDYEGVWKIYIQKIYRGTFGRVDKYFCDNCLILAIEGFHTGGGLRSDAIKKIKKTRREKRAIKRYWKKRG